MKIQKAKLFWRLGDKPKKIIPVSYDETQNEYYTFLKEQFDAGYRQIIVSSEIMISIIKQFVLSDELSIYDIHLSEDDDDMQNEINNLLRLVESNPLHFIALIDRLSFLAESSSIDIQRIKLHGYTPNGHPVDFFIQSNGLIGINEDAFIDIQAKVIFVIERCLFA